MDSGPFAMIAACTPSQLRQLKLKTETSTCAARESRDRRMTRPICFLPYKPKNRQPVCRKFFFDLNCVFLIRHLVCRLLSQFCFFTASVKPAGRGRFREAAQIRPFHRIGPFHRRTFSFGLENGGLARSSSPAGRNGVARGPAGPAPLGWAPTAPAGPVWPPGSC